MSKEELQRTLSESLRSWNAPRAPATLVVSEQLYKTLTRTNMAYIIGILHEDEELELRRRGWDIEPVPAGFLIDGVRPNDEDRYRLCYVDADMLGVMSGEGWEQEWTRGPCKNCGREYTDHTQDGSMKCLFGASTYESTKRPTLTILGENDYDAPPETAP